MPGRRCARRCFDLDQRSPQSEPGSQCRQQEDRPEYIDQEHKGQQHAHVGLKFKRRKRPGAHPDGHGQRGEDSCRAALTHGQVKGVAQVFALGHLMLNSLIQVNPVVDPHSNAQRHHWQSRDLEADAQGCHQGIAQDSHNRQRHQDAQHGAERAKGQPAKQRH